MNKKYWLGVVAFALLFLPIKSMIFAKKIPFEDDNLWLEEIGSDAALSWVEGQNAVSQKTLEETPNFNEMRSRFLQVLNAKERIVSVQKVGKFYYNFWRDESHLKGILRRSSLEEYVSGSPVWETVLDLDALSEEEKESWSWRDFEPLHPEANRALFLLSRGGKDAVVVREFDLEKKAFVQQGFCLPEARTFVQWKDKDTLYVSTDFGAGTLTQSDYPRMVKEWTRGTLLDSTPALFTAKEEDMAISPSVFHLQGKVYETIGVLPTFFTSIVYFKKAGQWIQIDKPLDVELTLAHDHFLFTPRSDWMVGGATYPSGSVLAIEIDRYLLGDRSFKVLFSPTERSSLDRIRQTKNFVILHTLDNLQNRVFLWKKQENLWIQEELEVPRFGSLDIDEVDPNESDKFFLISSDYLTPTNLWIGDLKDKSRLLLQSMPFYFSAENLEIQQFEATSKDGTKVPYFQVSRKDIVHNGKNPTLLYGYGGFQISLVPTYSSLRGIGWLEQGGVFVEANIRGGGEFGPNWHNAARKEHRQRAFDDFIAVAEDLIRRGVTSVKQLGIQGGSNGGLLMGVMLTQRPDLYGAVLCQVPLLDMKRYHKLFTGASWIDEYGDPDKEEDWSFIQKYSPYHNLKKEESYPPIFFTTSTRDDRVHPGHARKMAAKMQQLGHQILYYENTEGGDMQEPSIMIKLLIRQLLSTPFWQKNLKKIPSRPFQKFLG